MTAGPFSQGQSVPLADGALSTPFPRVDSTTDRRASATVKRVDRWMLDNAVAVLERAGRRGAVIEALALEVPGKLPQATRDDLELILFGAHS